MSIEKYYHILDLTPGASFEEVKKSYRKYVKLYHPDRNKHPLASEKFKAIQNAYQNLKEILLSPEEIKKVNDNTKEYYRNQDVIYDKNKMNDKKKEKKYNNNLNKDNTYKKVEDKVVIENEKYSFFKKIFSKNKANDKRYEETKENNEAKMNVNLFNDSENRKVKTQELIEKLQASRNIFIRLFSFKLLCLRNVDNLLDILLWAANSDDAKLRKAALNEIKKKLDRNLFKEFEDIWISGTLSQKFQILTIAEEFKDIRFKILFRLHKQKLPQTLVKRIYNFLEN